MKYVENTCGLKGNKMRELTPEEKPILTDLQKVQKEMFEVCLREATRKKDKDYIRRCKKGMKDFYKQHNLGALTL